MNASATGLVVVTTTTLAKDKPTTVIEFDRGILSIKKGRAEELYTVQEFSTGWKGRAFRLVKDRTGDIYDVFVGSPRSTCDCIGHERFERCKHVDSLQHLISKGRI